MHAHQRFQTSEIEPQKVTITHKKSLIRFLCLLVTFRGQKFRRHCPVPRPCSLCHLPVDDLPSTPSPPPPIVILHSSFSILPAPCPSPERPLGICLSISASSNFPPRVLFPYGTSASPTPQISELNPALIFSSPSTYTHERPRPNFWFASSCRHSCQHYDCLSDAD